MPKTSAPLVRAKDSPPLVLAVAQMKGGVGKTTTSINLAYEMSRFSLYDEAESANRSLRALLIDLDPQANSTSGLGVEVPAEGDMSVPSVWNVLTTDRNSRMALNDVIVGTDFGVDLAPARMELEGLDADLGPGGQMRLARELQGLVSYDVVFIDCRPALQELTFAALSAATAAMAVVIPGADEVEALGRLEAVVDDISTTANPGLQIGYVLVARFKASLATKEIRRAVANAWPQEYLGSIAETVRVTEAKAHQRPISVHDPKATAAQDYQAVATEIARRRFAGAVDGQ